MKKKEWSRICFFITKFGRASERAPHPFYYHLSQQWAITNVELSASFEYYEKDVSGVVESNSLVRRILFSFRKGQGHSISNRSMKEYKSFEPDNIIEEGEMAFRIALYEQVYQLLGHEPRIDHSSNDGSNTDKEYYIYYS